MNINKTMASALLLLAVCLITACSAGDAPPATTTTSTSNATVVANAGPDQSVFTGTFVTLNGSNSTNANGTGLTYAWTLDKPAGSNATLSNPNIVNPTFTPDIGGAYQCTLAVSNAQNLSMTSATSTTTVTASGTNPPPAANVGTTPLNASTGRVNAFTGRAIVLDGSKSSDANGDSITFRWNIAGKPTGSAPALFDAGTVAPSFTADMAGTYILNLVVSDGTSSSTPASVTINASDKFPPTADAGPDQFVLPTTAIVTLNGSNSHTTPTDEELKYKWIIINSSVGVTQDDLVDVDKAIARLNLPSNTAGTVVAQLEVTEPNHPDAAKKTVFDQVMVTIGPQAVIKVFKLSIPPDKTPIYTCDITACPPSSTVVVRKGFTLDSTESLVQPLTNLWSVKAPKENFTLLNPEQPRATFSPTVAGSYPIQLKVTEFNDLSKSATQSFTIIAKVGASADFNPLPLKPGSGQTVIVTLKPTIDEDPALTYEWIFVPPAGSSAKLSSTTDRNPTFNADIAGDYTVTLTVKDGTTNDTDSRPKTITANTEPTAKITLLPDPPSVCSVVTLDGSSSSDSDGTVSSSSYSWTLRLDEDGSSVSLQNPDTPKPKFKADKKLSYTAELVVTDDLGLASDKAVKSFIPVPDPTGLAIFNGTNDGTSPLTGIGPCKACHTAGSQGGGTLSGIDLNNVNDDKVTAKVQTQSLKMGGPTTLTGQALTDKIHDLRVFLNSTLPSCP